MGRSGCLTKGRNWGRVSLQAQKFERSFSIGYYPHQKIESPCPSSDPRPHIGKKSLIAFRQILPKMLPVACIFSYIIIKTY